jgi:hypothetical protein
MQRPRRADVAPRTMSSRIHHPRSLQRSVSLPARMSPVGPARILVDSKPRARRERPTGTRGRRRACGSLRRAGTPPTMTDAPITSAPHRAPRSR